MALRFMDSFDHYATADILTKYTAHNNMNISSGGRSGNRVVGGVGSQTNYVMKVLDSQPTWIIGAAVIFPGIGNTNYLFLVVDGAITHVSLRYDSGGHLALFGPAGLLATSSFVYSPTIWSYLEFKVTIADAGGTAVAKVNGTTVINFTGDTRNGGNASADRIYIGEQAGSNITTSFDDLYICDGIDQSIAETGSLANNDFLGDVRVQALFPNGDGNSSQFLGSDGNSVNNSLLVDESTPNGDTDYVESSTINDKDTYAMGNLTPTTGTVYGVQVLPYARKTDAGARTFKSVLRLSGTEVDSASKSPSITYAYLPDIRGTKPGGGTWSVTDVNAVEAGIKIDS